MENSTRWFLVLTAILCTCAGFSDAQTTPDVAAKPEHEPYRQAWSSAVDAATPEGYLFVELRRCAGCHEASKNSEGNTTHRNAIGLSGELVPPQESIVHAVPAFDRRPSSTLPGFSWVAPGELAAMPLPGDHGSLVEDADFLQSEGIRVLISLTETAPDREVLAAANIEQVHIPVRDFTAPTIKQIDEFVAIVESSVARGEAVGVHCTAGLGRSGTMAAAYLVATGASAEEAMTTVRQLRPGSIETELQEAAVREFEAHLSKRQ